MKKMILMSLFLISSFIMFGCQKTDYDLVSGVYVMESAMLGDHDVTDEYYTYQITLHADQTMQVIINYLNILENRNSTYEIKNNKLIESYQKMTYTYIIDENNKSLKLTIDQEGELLVVTLIKKDDSADTPEGVIFESVLFGESIDLTKRFNYAPSILIEEVDGETIMHIWYCANQRSGVIVDHVGYRKGVLNDDNQWVFSEESYALAPTVGTWDSRHTCDPSVIKGEFYYEDEMYPYMMSYLGCTTEDYSNNETGIAIAKHVEGPWIKMDHLNPIVPWDRDNQDGTWGTGMPSLLSVDEKGRVLLFYSNSSVGVSVDYYDFSNLNEPELIFTRNILASGLKNPNGTSMNYVGLADFSYDPVSKRLYMSSYTPTKDPADVTKTMVNSHGAVHYIEGLNDMSEVVSAIENLNYRWQLLDFIGPEDTGFDRNHNLGLVRNEYGYIYDSHHIMVVVSTGHIDYPNDNIFTYRLMGYIIEPQ